MNNKVLVAYASKYGSTREIAEKIAQILAQSGFETETLAAERVSGLADYKAVILGSAAYIGNWRAPAAKFVRKFEQELARVPVWIFSSGPLGSGDAMEEMKGWKYPKSLEPVISRINPRDITVFHGRANFEKMNVLERWMMQRLKQSGSDARRWDLIEEWAKGIAGVLK
ncbi:MAG TPA: flavodoxin domain-containing protein [Dehalococcoidales bacterium]|nr:flavodoxin domain-containing protein [Dehalococcoidales bacterium]